MAMFVESKTGAPPEKFVTHYGGIRVEYLSGLIAFPLIHCDTQSIHGISIATGN